MPYPQGHRSQHPEETFCGSQSWSLVGAELGIIVLLGVLTSAAL